MADRAAAPSPASQCLTTRGAPRALSCSRSQSLVASQLARTQWRGWVSLPLVCIDRVAARQVGERKRPAVPGHLQVQHPRDVALHGIQRHRVRDLVTVAQSGFLRLRPWLEPLDDLLRPKDRLVVEAEVELADRSRYAAEAGPEIVRFGQHQSS